MGHAHVMVIHHDSQHVGGRAVGTKQHEVVQILVLPYHAALHLILDYRLASEGCLKPNHRLNAGWGFCGIAIAPAAVIELGTSFAARLFAHLRELLGRGIATVGAACLQQRASDLPVALRARELVDGLAVPIEAKPGEAIEDRIDRRLGGALPVGILDPQEHFAAAPAGIQPIEQRRARPPDVQEARG